MKVLQANSKKRVLRFAGLGLLILAVTGSTCTKDVNSEIVISVDVTAPFHAEGKTNQYSDTAHVDLGAEVNLPKILADNGIESIQEIAVESVFYDVTVPDSVTTRTVTNNLITVHKDQGAESTLFQVTSVLVDDPAIRDPNWGTAPLERGGVNVLNAALAELVHNTGDPQLTFRLGGTSSPTNVKTNFWWQARVRLKVVGVRKVTVLSP